MEEIVFFDIESTGTSITDDRIVSLSLILLNEDLQEIESKKLLLNPTILIPQEATNIHHITNEMVKDCYKFSDYAPQLYKYLIDRELAGYNITKFDVPMLSEEFARCRFEFPRKDVKLYDSFVLWQKKEPKNLTSAYKYFTGLDLEDAHDAEADNRATIDVFKCQLTFFNMELKDVIEVCKDDSNKVDFAGKIILNKDGIACFNFGKKTKGVPVLNDIGFANWMLTNDFAINTKNVVKSILNEIKNNK